MSCAGAPAARVLAGQVVHAEQPLRVHPGSRRAESGGRCEACELSDRVLVRTLRENALALPELDGGLADVHRLGRLADERHFDPALLLIVDGAVPNALEAAIRAELAIDAGEKSTIEHALHAVAVLLDGGASR